MKGSDLIGCAVSAPLATFPQVYILPLLTISMNKGKARYTSPHLASPHLTLPHWVWCGVMRCGMACCFAARLQARV